VVTELDVDLQDVLLASQQLSGLAGTYGEVVTGLSGISAPSDVFETGEVGSSWTGVVETLWGFCADSQDNLNKTSRTLIHFINAICAEDGSHAESLLAEVQDYNEALGNTGSGGNGDPLPEPEVNPDDGTVIDPPDFDEADRPEEN
jgi:hypothetical protein